MSKLDKKGSEPVNCNHSSHEPETFKMCVSGVPIFNHLSTEEMLKVVKTSRSKSYQKGEVIFHPGDPADNLLIIHKGRVKIYRVSELGKEHLLRILEPGDFIGDISLFTNDTFGNYAEAMTPTEICSIHRSDIQGLLINYPKISIKILEELGKRLNEAELTIERLSLHDAEKRVASYLIEQIRAKKELGSAPINLVLPMSKKDLASYIGTTQETLSRRLSTFQDRGWIEQSGQRSITILNHDALLKAAE